MVPHFFYPSIALKQYISKYWYWINIDAMPVLPPGSGSELFIFNKKIAVYDASRPNNVHYVDSVLIRPRYAPIHFCLDEPVSFISIRFRLGSINTFIKDFEADYETIVNPYDLWGDAITQLRENIIQTQHLYNKVMYIEDFLLNRLRYQYRPVTNKLSLTNEFLNRVYYGMESVSLKEIAQDIGYSQRHLQKTVKLVTGLSLVEVKRLIRFEHAMKQVLTHNTISFSNQDHLNHYYDQAHFIKEFSYFTEMSPKKFLLKNKTSSHFYNRIASTLDDKN